MTNQKKGLALVFSTAVISGFSIFISGISVKMIDPSAFTFLKNGIVGITLLSIILGTAKWKELKSLKTKQWLYLAIIGLVGGSIPFFLFFNGLAMTSGTTGAFIHKTMFLYVALMAPLFLKEKLSGWIFPAAVILLLSNFLLLNADFKSLGIGHLLILIATLLWAAENTFSKFVLKNMSGTVLAFGRMFFGSLFMLAYLGLTNQLGPVFTMNGEQWLWTLIPTTMLLGYVLTWYNGLKYVPVSLATVILLLGSPITTLLNFVLLQKPVNPGQWMGILLTIIGISLWHYWQTINAAHRKQTSGSS